MSAKNIRLVGILFGVLMVLCSFTATVKWVKVLLFVIGAVKIAGNLLADDKLYENIEAQINEQINNNFN